MSCQYILLRHLTKNQLCFQITTTILNQLMDKIREDLPGLEGSEETEQIRKHFENTINHIDLKRQTPDEGSPSYEGISI